MTSSDSNPTHAVTRLISRIRSGSEDSREELATLVYGELRRIAEACFRTQPASHTLQPTALVHEAFAKLVRGDAIGTGGRAEFFAVAARAMRQILVDHARTRKREKRGGASARVAAGEAPDSIPSATGADPGELLDLDRALEDLALRDERQARIVELRFFAGLEMSEVATCLGVSLSTAEREWRVARAWLGQRLAGG